MACSEVVVHMHAAEIADAATQDDVSEVRCTPSQRSRGRESSQSLHPQLLRRHRASIDLSIRGPRKITVAITYQNRSSSSRASLLFPFIARHPRSSCARCPVSLPHHWLGPPRGAHPMTPQAHTAARQMIDPDPPSTQDPPQIPILRRRSPPVIDPSFLPFLPASEFSRLLARSNRGSAQRSSPSKQFDKHEIQLTNTHRHVGRAARRPG
ncbi:hypothetical protein B0H15DRAFT_299709 [Mycena belliarum]|uniref:Uncharacterized protein n=1 Tax=Mycena belliarum TaxID=1033014 RepID=A0AAD6XU68_9AGAR|nr:hypothetical protein B0H15DRAFT_299709 [Mycena belliae]